MSEVNQHTEAVVQSIAQKDGQGGAMDSDNTRLQEIRERLQKGASIYEPSLLNDIREEYSDKKVVVFDCNGVLVGNYLNGENTLDENENSLEVLKQCKELGYIIVFWTNGPRDQITPLI